MIVISTEKAVELIELFDTFIKRVEGATEVIAEFRNHSDLMDEVSRFKEGHESHVPSKGFIVRRNMDIHTTPNQQSLLQSALFIKPTDPENKESGTFDLLLVDSEQARYKELATRVLKNRQLLQGLAAAKQNLLDAINGLTELKDSAEALESQLIAIPPQAGKMETFVKDLLETVETE